jgi:hypothetical protein
MAVIIPGTCASDVLRMSWFPHVVQRFARQFTEIAEKGEGHGEGFINLNSASLALLSDLGELPFRTVALIQRQICAKAHYSAQPT